MVMPVALPSPGGRDTFGLAGWLMRWVSRPDATGRGAGMDGGFVADPVI